jgi:uncharacterized protein (DUF1499 family)
MFSSSSKKVDQIQEIENPLPACPDTPNCERVSITLDYDSTNVMNTTDQVLRAMNAQTIEWNEESKIINSVFKIPLFGFLDDMDIAIRQQGSSTVLFIRSASREGYSDLGVNKRRVNKFIRKLNILLSS